MKTSRFSLIAISCVFVFISYSCSSGGGDSTVGGIPITCGDSSNVYVRTDGSDDNPGTISQPLLTIQAAVSCGQPGQTIRVANGTYESNMNGELIVLVEGKSIYGGYSSDFQVRDPSVYPTIITDVTDMSINSFGWSTAVATDQGATPNTVLDGFTINGTTVGLGSGEVHVVDVSGSPTISNNIINGGGNGATNYARTVQLQYDSSGAVIKNNIITSGISTGISWGIESYASGPITILNNTINGGSSDYSTRAIDISMLNTDGSVISNNTIYGGSGSESYGVYFKAAASVTIEANTIVSGSNSMSSNYGIYSESGAPVIRNNTIILEGGTSYGVYNFSNSVISSNTIVGGGSNDSWGIYTKSATSAVFLNNIIDITGGICVAEDDANSDPATLKNNNLTGCTNLYYDEGTTNIASIIAVNALSITDASDNVSLPSSLDSTKDYQLTISSPIEVKLGGLDLSSDFSIDKAGISRTVPWSIGAYEYD
jgi:hypothetical protein